MSDQSALLQAQVSAARATRTPLLIRGGGSRDFYARPISGELLAVDAHRGILQYEASELVLTARAGTALAEIEAALAEHGQMLAFEPPAFSAASTLGGAIACGMSGPRRASAGAARDFVLGVRCINGRGEVLRFGGQVMKNVAGYDVSRLMCGALGTLGVLLDISLKVLPLPEYECSVARQCTQAQAIALMNRWAAQPLPLSASSWHGGVLRVRLSGAASAVRAAASTLGGDSCAEEAEYWRALRDQRLRFFAGAQRLWRLSVPPATPPLALPEEPLLEWGGALRWLWSERDATAIRAEAAAAGGHATLYRGAVAGEEVFQTLEAGMTTLHRNLKRAFDPDGILNPGRMYAGL